MKRCSVLGGRGSLFCAGVVATPLLTALPPALPPPCLPLTRLPLASLRPAALNVAWSWHEIVSDYVRPTLMWMEAKGKANLAALVSAWCLLRLLLPGRTPKPIKGPPLPPLLWFPLTGPSPPTPHLPAGEAVQPE